MFNTVMVPLDGSKYSEQALPYAKSVARGRDLELVLVRAPAIPTPVLEGVLVNAEHRRKYVDEVESSIDSYLGNLQSELKAEGFQVRTRRLDGPATEAILSAVKEDEVDLLVMCTRGENAPHATHYGSVAERVHRNAPCATLLVNAVVEEDDDEE